MAAARLILGLIAAAAATTALAQTVPVPIPRPKPAQAVEAGLTVPIPRPKPSPGIESAPPPAAAKPWPKDYGKWPKSDVLAARQRCAAMMASRNIIWRPDQPIGSAGGCGTPAPIAIAEVSGVRINPPATVNCDFAVALDDWLNDTVQPAARKAFSKQVSEVQNASSYACRRRNNGRSGKLSEHAKANALDIAAFVFTDKSEVSVKGKWSGLFQSVGLSRSGNFLRSIRKDACAYFNTVLGPGSDPYHKDHFHVDLMKLRPGRFKLCR